MRVGLDVFSIWDLRLDPFETLDWAAGHGFEGVQFGPLRSLSDELDAGRLAEVAAHARALGLYTYVSLPPCNPHAASSPPDEHVDDLKRQITLSASFGWHELHSILGGPEERYGHRVPWEQQLEESAQTISRLGPVLREHGSRINLETHGDTTTFELVRVVERTGEEIAGICLDTANVLCFAEDPLAAARRAAPYTHLTHTKDAIVLFYEGGLRRQVRPPGHGVLRWEEILPVLAEHSPDLPLSVEDHKGFYEIPVFEEGWHEENRDLTRVEFASVMGLAWECQRRIGSSVYVDPEVYEAIPYSEQMEERLSSARDHLNRILGKRSPGTG